MEKEQEMITEEVEIMSFKASADNVGYESDEIYDENSNARGPNMPDILKVLGAKGNEKGYVMRLAKSIVSSCAQYNYAELQGVGAGAVNNMVKAFIKAKSYAQDHMNGLSLANQMCFVAVRMEPDAEPITAIRMKVFGIPSRLIP